MQGAYCPDAPCIIAKDPEFARESCIANANVVEPNVYAYLDDLD